MVIWIVQHTCFLYTHGIYGMHVGPYLIIGEGIVKYWGLSLYRETYREYSRKNEICEFTEKDKCAFLN